MALSIASKADDADKHKYDVSCLLYHKNKLYSAADDGKIKLWANDLKLITEVEAHPCSVYSLTASDDTIYSCSNEGTVKSWTLDLKEKGLIYKDESEMWKAVYYNGLLYVGDDQGVVKIFKNDKFFSAVNILEPVKDMIIVNRLLFAIRDLYLTIAELNIKDDGKGNFSIIKAIPGRGPVSLVGDKLCYMSREGKDVIISESSRELQFKEVTQIKDASDLIINTVLGVKKDDIILIYTGGWDKIVKQWKFLNGKTEPASSCNVDFCVHVLTEGEKGQIYAAGADGHLVRIDC